MARGPNAREGAEEQVDGDALADGLLRVQQLQVTVSHRKMLVGRNGVDVVRQNLHRTGNLRNGHLRALLQHLREVAFVVGQEVHDHHEGHSSVGGHPVEKGLQCAYASRGRAETHDGKLAGLGPGCRLVSTVVAIRHAIYLFTLLGQLIVTFITHGACFFLPDGGSVRIVPSSRRGT